MSSGPPPPPPPPPPHDDEDDYEASVSNRFARDVGALVGLALLTTALMRHTWSLVRWHRAHAAGSGKFHERLFRFLLAAHLVWSLHCVLIFARGTMTLQTGRNWSSGQLACEIAARLVSSLYTSGYACLGFFFRWKFSASRRRVLKRAWWEWYLLRTSDAALAMMACTILCWVVQPYEMRAVDNGRGECALRRDVWFAAFMAGGYLLWSVISVALLVLFLSPLAASLKDARDRSEVSSDAALRTVVRRNLRCFVASCVTGVLVVAAIVVESFVVPDQRTNRGLATASILGPVLDMYVNSAAALHSLNLTFIGSSLVDFRRRLCGGDGDDAAGALFRASSGASFGRRRFSGLFRNSTAARRSGGASPRGAVEVAARRVDTAFGGANPLRAPHRPSNAPPRAASAEDET